MSRSAVFDSMLNQDMKEAQVGEVDILDVDPDTLKKMLEFIYTGQVLLGFLFSKLFTCMCVYACIQNNVNRLKTETTLQSFSTLQTNMNSARW